MEGTASVGGCLSGWGTPRYGSKCFAQRLRAHSCNLENTAPKSAQQSRTTEDCCASQGVSPLQASATQVSAVSSVPVYDGVQASPAPAPSQQPSSPHRHPRLLLTPPIPRCQGPQTMPQPCCCPALLQRHCQKPLRRGMDLCLGDLVARIARRQPGLSNRQRQRPRAGDLVPQNQVPQGRIPPRAAPRGPLLTNRGRGALAVMGAAAAASSRVGWWQS